MTFYLIERLQRDIETHGPWYWTGLMHDNGIGDVNADPWVVLRFPRRDYAESVLQQHQRAGRLFGFLVVEHDFDEAAQITKHMERVNREYQVVPDAIPWRRCESLKQGQIGFVAIEDSNGVYRGHIDEHYVDYVIDLVNADTPSVSDPVGSSWKCENCGVIFARRMPNGYGECAKCGYRKSAR